MIGQRFVESEAYQRAREVFRAGQIPADMPAVQVLDDVELRSALRLRTFSDLTAFSIDGVPYVGEQPAVARVPSKVETIPVTKDQVELASEASETTLAAAVPSGAPLPEAAMNFGATAPSQQLLPRVGTSVPVTMGMLDEPGVVASLLDRRLTLGVGLGLENEMLNGNFAWTGMLAAAGATPVVRTGGTYRSFAIRNGVSEVQANGWYVRPLQVVLHPTTYGAMFEEEDGSQRPLAILDMFDSTIDAFIVSTQIAVGSALVGDLFEAVGLFMKGGLEVAVARNHQDQFTRSMAELALEFRAFSWVRQAGALCEVTGL